MIQAHWRKFETDLNKTVPDIPQLPNRGPYNFQTIQLSSCLISGLSGLDGVGEGDASWESFSAGAPQEGINGLGKLCAGVVRVPGKTDRGMGEFVVFYETSQNGRVCRGDGMKSLKCRVLTSFLQ